MVNPDKPLASQQMSHRKDIDGLRSVAVLSVLGYHCGIGAMSGGFVGVDVFFVISGYLICGLIVRDLDRERFSIARFYERRCKRILPALFVVLLFCIIASLVICSPYEARQVGQSIMAAASSTSNVLFYRQGNYFEGTGRSNPLLMTWSLAVEEQFYIAFPLLMLLLYKKGKKRLFGVLSVLCLLSLLTSIYMEFHHAEFNFYLPFTRAWELGAGVLLAFYEAHAKRPVLTKGVQNVLSALGLVLIVGSVCMYTPGIRFPGYEAIPPVLGSVLMLASPRGLANRVLALSPFVWVGLISYSLYLWHWPLLSFFALIVPAPASAINLMFLMGCAFVLATLSYFLVEQPFRKRVAPTSAGLIFRYASCSAAFLLAASMIYFSGGVPGRARQLAATERSLDLDRPHTCLTMLDTRPNLEPGCVPPAGAGATIALLGDSHAEALQPALEEYAEAHGEQLLIMAMPSCPPLQGVTRFVADAPLFAMNCARFNEETVRLVSVRNDVKYVLLTGSWPMVQEDVFLPADFHGDWRASSDDQHVTYLLQGLEAEVRSLEAAGKHVIVVDDNPSLRLNPLARLRYADLPVRREIVNLFMGHPIEDALAHSVARAQTVNPAAEDVRLRLLSLTRTDPQLTVIDTKSIFCDETACALSDGENLFYTDANHISHFGEQRVVERIDLAVRGNANAGGRAGD